MPDEFQIPSESEKQAVNQESQTNYITESAVQSDNLEIIDNWKLNDTARSQIGSETSFENYSIQQPDLDILLRALTSSPASGMFHSGPTEEFNATDYPLIEGLID